MNHYQYLQNLLDRFPNLFSLQTETYANELTVKVLNEKGAMIIEKKVVVEDDISEDQEMIIKDNCAYDILSSMFLMSAATIRDKMKQNSYHEATKLN